MFDLSFENLSKDTENIYEAVAIMAQRSRQVHDEQRQKIQQEKEENPIPDTLETHDFDDVHIDREALNRKIKVFPKPTTVAMQEMHEGKIAYHYKSDDETASAPAK